MEIDTREMKVADRLDGTVINGYAGYYQKGDYNGRACLVIVIPHDPTSIERLMQEIDLKV